jgi:protein-disulfide isomerase
MAKTRRTRLARVVLGLLPVTLLGAPLGFSQSSDEVKDLRKEIESLKEGQKQMQKELEAIKALLLGRQAPSPPQEVVLSVDGAPVLGEKNAKLTLVEFSDYQCPFCARHFNQTWPQLVSEYIETGKVRYVVRDFPLESMHPLAFKAAEAAHCAGEQGKYWEMHNRLLANQSALGAKNLPLHAQALGLDLPAFQQCLDSGKEAARVRKDLDDGEKAGVEGTPTFFLGLTEQNDSKIKATRRLGGALPYPRFKQAIDSLLAPSN